MIKYTQCKVSKRATFKTQRFGNLLSDTISGEVDQSGDGTWNGWLMNWSRKNNCNFKLGFGSRAAAARWVNQKLRERGVS